MMRHEPPHATPRVRAILPGLALGAIFLLACNAAPASAQASAQGGSALGASGAGGPGGPGGPGMRGGPGAHRGARALMGIFRAIDGKGFPGGRRMLRHCDPNPKVTYTTVCGRQVPATMHFEWTSCQMPAFGHHRHGGMGRGGTSSGTVDITRKVSASDATCSASTTITGDTTVAYDLTMSGPRGGSMHLAGTKHTASSHPWRAKQRTKTITLDDTHAFTLPDGTSKSGHLAGTVTLAIDRTNRPGTRTYDGKLDVTRPDGVTGTVTLDKVVRDGRCPVSGTVTSTMSDGTTHTVVFGPTCGQATVDGKAVTLPRRPFGHHHRGHGFGHGRWGGPGGPGGPGGQPGGGPQ